ncbi:GNAT family N-acetyltransferase [Jannaschia sp. CCS1]|uniref:GNAT family N-acetyltransferase n=1 Tax=Jannaschia sp. (strain CCS1) TaxID=290400 RepID=UPI000053C672|nr:GNAT family protein [Jannaschia sp. CCS1]ABD56016.1 GCN5-related N-acetyltransferase [Jannaschia sp. CCS1]
MTTPDHETPFPRPLSGARLDHVPPALLPPRTALEGRDVVLEPMNAAVHAEDLFAESHGTIEGLKIWDYMTYGPWSDLESYAGTLRDQSAAHDPLFYAIRSRDSGRACGQASFLDTDAKNGVTEIGHIWFGPTLQRTRGATEALFLMLCHAMDDLGYRRMQWRCNALNAKSRAAARRLGFRFEGIFYNNLIFKGRNRDTAWYSILDDEWPEIRDRISTWLRDDNFGSDGRAKSSLSDAMQNRSPSTRGQLAEPE